MRVKFLIGRYNSPAKLWTKKKLGPSLKRLVFWKNLLSELLKGGPHLRYE